MDQGRREGEERVIDRAKNDSEYRAELLNNPAAAVAAETGWQIPAGVSIKVVEETADTFYLVIPHVDNAESGELSDEELENVAGGRDRCLRESWSCNCTA